MHDAPVEITITSHHQQWQALRWGPENGVPVLAIHGWLDNAATFWWLTAHLPKDWCVVAVDMAGHGRSNHKPVGATYPFTEWVLDVHRILDGLGWTEVHLLGHSMGAGICGLFAGTFPERVKSFAAIEGIAPLTAAPEETPGRLQSYIMEEVKTNRRPLKSYRDIDAAVSIRAMAGKFSNKTALRPMVERNLERKDAGFMWTTDGRLRRPSAIRMTREQVAAFLVNISAPVLLIRATDGLKVAADSIVRIRELIPNLTYEEISGFHHPHLDDPKVVGSVISAWWDGLKR